MRLTEYSITYNVWNFMRGYTKTSVAAAAKRIKQNLKVYPLPKKDNPPKMEFKNMSGVFYKTVAPNDYTFFEDLNQIIQEEPEGFYDAANRSEVCGHQQLKRRGKRK
jgi:hypothetical protein